MLESQKKIIIALGIRNGQTFTELEKSSGVNRDSLAKGLKELKPHIEKNKKDNHWYLSETRNKILIKFKKSQVMSDDLQPALKELEESGTPFELGHMLVYAVLRFLSQLTLELHKEKVSDVDKVQIEKVIEYCNKVIEGVFDVLKKKDTIQADKLAESLNLAALIPITNLYNFDALKPKEKRLYKSLHEKLSPYVFEAIERIKD